MEILGFNLLHWTTSTLPWENISDPKVVEEKKKSLMVSFASSSKKLIPSAPTGKIFYLHIQGEADHPSVQFSDCTEFDILCQKPTATAIFRPQQIQKNYFNSAKHPKMALLKGWGGFG